MPSTAASTLEYPTAYSPSTPKCLTDISNLMWIDSTPNLVCVSLPFLPVAQAKYLRVTLNSCSITVLIQSISKSYQLDLQDESRILSLFPTSMVQPSASHDFWLGSWFWRLAPTACPRHSTQHSDESCQHLRQVGSVPLLKSLFQQ